MALFLIECECEYLLILSLTLRTDELSVQPQVLLPLLLLPPAQSVKAA